VGKTDHAFYPAELAARLIADEQHVMQSGQPMIDYEESLVCPASGEMCWISTTQVPIHDQRGVVVGLIGIGRDITTRKLAEEERQARLARLERQQRTIVTLATHPTVLSGDFEAACRIITELVAKTMEIERCSVWLLEDDKELRCVNLFERSPARHSGGVILQAERYPRYFEAIRAARVIDAHDVLADPRTDEFSEDYLIPLGITSLLDAPVRVAGRVIGVVCHEHVGPVRRWHDDEIVFAGEVADQVAQALLNHERQKAEEALRRSQERLELALRGADLGMYDYHLRTGEVVINEQYAKMLGYTLRAFQ
jgi:PAS domain-containing protein